MTGRFDGARVIVTGGARGIGAGIVRRFAAEGAQVTVIDVLDEPGEQLAAEVAGRYARVDLADPDAGDAVSALIAAQSGVDVLVTAAGVLHLGSLLDTEVATWDRVQTVNVRGTFVAMKAAAAAMIRAGRGGAIIALSSMAAKKGGANEGAYAASKHAVIGLVRAGAGEWGAHQIRVNAVCPGYVLTEMGAATRTEADIALWSSYSPLGRLGTVDDVAGLVAFLAGPDGRYLTGQAINVTGGMAMN